MAKALRTLKKELYKPYDRILIGAYLDVRFIAHGLRHTSATWWAKKKGVAIVQQMLGYSNISTTNIYLHVTGRDVVAAMQRA